MRIIIPLTYDNANTDQGEVEIGSNTKSMVFHVDNPRRAIGIDADDLIRALRAMFPEKFNDHR